MIVNKGDAVKVTCSILQGVPDPLVTWTREDGRPFSTAVKTTPKYGLKQRDGLLYLFSTSHSTNLVANTPRTACISNPLWSF